MGMTDLFRSKLELEAKAQRLELVEILKREDNSKRVDAARELAEAVGASTIKRHPGYGHADLPELVANIHEALQTKAMIASVQTASNYFIVTVILSVIAFFSTVAAFIAAFSRS
jgi:uncharacterized protein with GYD domain